MAFFIAACFALAALMAGPIAGPSWAQGVVPSDSITISGADTGRTFDGIGALSAGASSRLLIDYPPKQRREILDYLFRPDFGAALQINKVEIGGDANSTDGSEPSHSHTPTDHDYHRGYEWWLMAESKKRNPRIRLYGLEWATPGWINPAANNVWTQNNVGYLLDWVAHAKSVYGLTIDYLGGWNERGYDARWYESLRAALDARGFKGVKVVGDDSFHWDVGKAIAADPAFAASVAIVGQHYPDVSPQVKADAGFQDALASGKPLWLSEMGSQGYNDGAANLARNFNWGYVDARATADINWSTIWSVYDGLPYGGCGLMLANEPWSGHYVVGASIWVVAHTTQFAQPGWQYLNGACGFFGGAPNNGSYVTLTSPNRRDYSVIIETTSARTPRTARFAVSGGLSAGTVHVWQTDLRSKDSRDWFVRRADVAPVGGSFAVTLAPGCVYSLTTTTGQAKGETKPPASVMLRLPCRDDFQEYPLGGTPRLFSDQMGTFEIAQAGGGRSGKCLRQVVTRQPVLWSANGDPSTLVGDPRWSDYRVSTDVLLEQPGYVDLVGRMMNTAGGNSNVINGYHLRVADTGTWSLIRKDGDKETALASGTTAPFTVGTWHSLALAFAFDRIDAAIDGTTVVRGLQDNDYITGLAGYEVSRWQNAEFQNFRVDPVHSGVRLLFGMSATATSEQPGYEAALAVDGSADTFWHTQFAPTAAALPQSLTLRLPAAARLVGLSYLPRQDGQSNGRILRYTVSTSGDGIHFTDVSSGTWADDASLKYATFPAVAARCLRLTAEDGVGGFASAAEVRPIAAVK